MVLLDLDSGSCFIFLLTQRGAEGWQTHYRKKLTGSARPKCVFLRITVLRFFRTDCFFPLDVLPSGGAKASSDPARFGSTIQGDRWFWRLSGMRYTMNVFCEEQSHLLSAVALRGLKTGQAWLEFTNWVWIFIVLQCQKV